ncbi:MAG: membrane protein insertase YidC [Thermaurantiacus sp.]
MTSDNRNLLLALVLSGIVLFGWAFVQETFFPNPQQMATGTPQAAQEAAPAAPAPAADPAPAAVPGAAQARTLEQALAAPRVAIETPRLRGSINLEGARIDDLVLLDHRQALDRDSPPVRLFAPSGTPEAYFAGTGWTGTRAPPPDARWEADGERLTPATPVTLRWNDGRGLAFEIRLEVDDTYLFTATQRVMNRSSEAAVLRGYGYINRTGTGPDPSTWNIHTGPIAVLNGNLVEGDIGFDKLRDRGAQTFVSRGGWLGITDKYWLSALIPAQATTIEARFTPAPGNRTQVDYLLPPAILGPNEMATTSAHLFAGAKEVRLLNQVRDDLGAPLFDRAIAWGWFWALAQPIFMVLQWLHGISGNWALAIIGLTILVRIILYPLANKQYSSMAKMRVFAPKMKEIQERHKDDKPKQQQEMMELYKREKINPLAGCLPILVQIPIFYALYKTLLIAIEIRHQPGLIWIQDLSAPDPLTPVNLFGLLPFTPPPIIAIGILPILLGITMWVQFRLNPQPLDELQKKIFSWMPWILVFVMAPFAAGLQIYWVMNNLISILQQWVLIRKYPAPAPAPAAAKAAPADKAAEPKPEPQAQLAAPAPQGPGQGQGGSKPGSRRGRRRQPKSAPAK